ncbi:MAG: hypothetical protein J6U64_01815, partial [Alphaproteobacteria bacterium]|nr:hypothetical protein [Alphaproteobacteria bacterium]
FFPNISLGILILLWGIWGYGLLFCLSIPVSVPFKMLFALLCRCKKIGAFVAYCTRLKKVAKEKAPTLPKVIKKKKTSKKVQNTEVVKEVAPKKKGFELPPMSLVDTPKEQTRENLTKDEMNAVSEKLESVLVQFGVKGRVVRVSPGPVVTLYEFEPAPGVKVERVINLADNIALAMKVVSVRMAILPATGLIGIEMPNGKRTTVYIKELLDVSEYKNNTAHVPLILGMNIAGNPFYADLAKMPHLLVAGTTGSGKSVGINTMILSLLYRFTPEECRLIMVDPKMLELSVYNGIPHLLTPVVTEPGKAVVALKWAVREMEDRYRAMSEVGAKNIDSYNERVKKALAGGKEITRTIQTGFNPETGEVVTETQKIDLKPMPYIVVIVDEMADLMMVAGKDVEAAIQRLAQMARAAGIHLILATQRPSVDVLTGTIKANFPTRLSFQVTSKIDSRTILGEQGAEQLLGRGDMLYMAAGLKPVRLHGPFVSEGEVERVVAHLKSQGEVHYVSSVLEEETEADEAVFDKSAFGAEGDLYEQAVAVVVRDNKPSISYVQRQLRIGYNRAADLIDRMEKEGIVSKASPTGRREVLVGDKGNA